MEPLMSSNNELYINNYYTRLGEKTIHQTDATRLAYWYHTIEPLTTEDMSYASSNKTDTNLYHASHVDHVCIISSLWG